jgi:Sulfatase
MSINTKRNRTALVCLVGLLLGITQLQAQEVLPFPETPTTSTTGKTLADSKHQSRKLKNHLPKDAPNIVIFMTDDAGFSHPEVFGGPVHMPTMARLAESGITYNAFHTTAMCSPTRASLLTGRNHHRVGNGQVAEAATD